MTNERYGEDAAYQFGDLVYLMQDAGGRLKIGKTQSVKERLVGLKGYYGEKPAVLYLIDGYTEVEAALHETFAEYRITGKNGKAHNKSDWFRPVAEIEGWFRQNGLPYALALGTPYMMNGYQSSALRDLYDAKSPKAGVAVSGYAVNYLADHTPEMLTFNSDMFRGRYNVHLTEYGRQYVERRIEKARVNLIKAHRPRIYDEFTLDVSTNEAA